MVSFHNVRPTDPPSAEDSRFWDEEASFFVHRPGNPRAPQDSGEYIGWGIPKDKLPPADAVAYIMGRYREDDLGLRIHDRRHPQYEPLHPMFKWSFLSVCMAHFLWLRTAAGARWLMSLYGIQEIDPFYQGYAYFWADPKGNQIVHLEPPLYSQDKYTGQRRVTGGIELRIFREWEKCVDPPTSELNKKPVDDMKRLLERYRCPYANREMPLPDDAVFYWVSDMLRLWFLEPQPDKDWPTRKGDRITGWQWVRSLERAPGVPFYEALTRVPLYKGRAYRLKDPRGGVYWCGGNEMRLVPLNDLYRMQGTKTEPQIQQQFQCVNCRKVRPCVPYTGEYHRCCHCFGVELDSGDRATLDKCTSYECAARGSGHKGGCPMHLETNSDLVALKNKLNRPPRTGPVPR